MAMKRRTFSKALGISIILHFILLAILFLWPAAQKTAVESKVDVVFMNLKSQQIKRRNPPKKFNVYASRKPSVTVGRSVSKVPVANLRFANESAVYTDARIRSGDVDTLAAAPGIGMGGNISSINESKMRVYSRPIEMKMVATRDSKYKNRLMQFIERMDGPQDIIYGIDLSSSMNALGISNFQTVINIIQDSLRDLETEDRFNILTFGARALFYKPDMIPVTKNNVEDAVKFLNQIRPGNTPKNLETDLFTALEQSESANPSIIVLFSDGLPTSKTPGLKNIMDNIGGGSKIFTMTINMDETYPGAVLMKKLADKSAGEFWLVER